MQLVVTKTIGTREEGEVHAEVGLGVTVEHHAVPYRSGFVDVSTAIVIRFFHFEIAIIFDRIKPFVG